MMYGEEFSFQNADLLARYKEYIIFHYVHFIFIRRACVSAGGLSNNVEVADHTFESV